MNDYRAVPVFFLTHEEMEQVLRKTSYPAIVLGVNPLRAVLYNITDAHTQVPVVLTFSFSADSTVPLHLMPVGSLVRVWIDTGGYRMAPATLRPDSQFARDAECARAFFIPQLGAN